MTRLATLVTVLLLFFTLPLHSAITGRVIDEDGKPLRGARVRVRALETQEQSYAWMLSKDPQPKWLEKAETNDGGVFRIDTKSNPVVELMVDAPGRQHDAQDVADREDAGTFVLRKAAALRGRITAAGKGVAGATVVIGRSYVARSDAEGYYDTSDPGTGIDRILVIHSDYAVTDRPLRDRSTSEMSFDVTLKPGTALRGRVVDAAGRAVPGAVVRAAWWPLARTGEDGSFEIAHAPGEKPPLYAREGNRVGRLFTDRVKPPFVIQLHPAACISGTVRSNKDETVVPGARVFVRADVDGWRIKESSWLSAISDAKGNFTIDGLDAGACRIFASHPACFGGNHEMRLEEGARVNRIVYVAPYARLTGKVIDDEQKPLAAARVSLVASRSGVMTAPDGTFSLRFPVFERGQPISISRTAFASALFGPYVIEPGETKSGLQLLLSRGNRLEIRLVDRDGAPVAREPVAILRRTELASWPMRGVPLSCGPAERGKWRSDEQGRIAVDIAEAAYDIFAGGETTVRRELTNQTLDTRSSPMTIELERGAPVEGRVVWSDGSPLNIDIDAIVTTTLNSQESTPVIDGAFTLRNVPAGKLTVMVEGLPASSSTLLSEPVEVIAPASGVTLKLARFGRIEGHIVDRETERPVRDFSVSVQSDGRARMSSPKSFRADDGRFLLDDIAPGSYELRVQASGFISTNETAGTVEEAKAVNATVALDRGGTVVGRVTGEGRPLAEAMIVQPIGRDPRMMNAPAKTDSNGEYTLDGLPPGTQRLEVHRKEYVTKVVTITVTPGKETRADVDLTRGRELRGRVIDSTGRPVPQARIAQRGGQMRMHMSAITDNEGAFKLPGLGDLIYTLLVRKEGFVEITSDVNFATTSEVTITLSRGATITGRILGVAPADLPFVDVRASGSGGPAQPDAGGNFTLAGVPDGDVMIFASVGHPRPRNMQARLTVTNGIAPPVDLDFSSGVLVRGRVTLRGQIVEGHISFIPAERVPNPQLVWCEIGRDGMYEVRLAAPGEYQVTINRFGTNGMVTSPVTVAGEMVQDIELRGVNLSGVVVDAATRQPLANARVVMMPGGRTHTDGAGRFTLDLALAGDGKVRLHATAEGYAPDLRQLEVANGVAPEIELALPRGIVALIRVVDAATGQPVEVNIASIADASKIWAPFELESDPSGMQRVTLKPGTYELRLFVSGYTLNTVTLTVPGPPLDVRLERQKR